jgi:hypothetical protein
MWHNSKLIQTLSLTLICDYIFYIKKSDHPTAPPGPAPRAAGTPRPPERPTRRGASRRGVAVSVIFICD